MEGWISLHRKILESEIWEKPPLYMKVWIFLLLSAQHKQYKGLKPGQVLTSIPEIIEGVSWKVGARKERPTKDQVYQVLEFLRGKVMKSKRSPDESNENVAMITTTKATHKLLITICNYGVYQDKSTHESNGESNDEKPTKPLRKQRQPNNINNNDNNDNKTPSSRKNAKRIYEADNRYYQMAIYFHERIMSHAVANKVEHLVRNANMQNWADEFRKIVELDERDTKEMQRVIDWATSHSFWSPNILSPKKLRDKYSELGIKMAMEGKSGQGTSNRQTQSKDFLQRKKEAMRNDRGTDHRFVNPDSYSLPDVPSE